jgi:hypothetical protein
MAPALDNTEPFSTRHWSGRTKVFLGVVFPIEGECLGEALIRDPLRSRGLIEQGIVEGSLAPCDPKVAAFVLAGAISWIARWYRPDGPLAPDEITPQCIAILLNGLSSRAPAVVALQPVAPRLRRE